MLEKRKKLKELFIDILLCMFLILFLSYIIYFGFIIQLQYQ